MTVDLLGFGVGQSVAGADKVFQVLDVLRDGGGEEVAEPGAHYLFRPRVAVHPGHNIVALGEVAVAVEALYLLVGCEINGNRLLKLKAPDTFGALFDEASVTLLTLANPSLIVLAAGSRTLWAHIH